MAKLKFGQSGRLQKVELDGEDISSAVKGISIDVEAGDLPTVRLALAVFELETNAGDTKIHISPGTEDLLKRLGWTPPAEDPS